MKIALICIAILFIVAYIFGIFSFFITAKNARKMEEYWAQEAKNDKSSKEE